MANANELVPIIKECEGGFGWHPSDKGGATNSGVTLATYTYYWKQKGKGKPTVSDLKKMTDEEWMDIFKMNYWNPFKADSINNQSIANICVDWGFISGTRTAIKYVQGIVGVDKDGVVGSITINAINGYKSQKELFEKIKAKRKWHFDRIVAKNPSQKVFLRGWYARLAKFKYKD